VESRSTFSVTPATRVHRSPARASYDRDVAYAILDEALVVSVAFVEGDQPFVIPMAFARAGDRLILHAASSSRFSRVLASGARLCVTATLLDGLVLARSAMHHSLNYRSVVVLGAAEEVTDPDAKLAFLARLVDHVVDGRSAACRPPNALELKATRVFSLPLEEVSVKRRSGGPLDDEEDLELPFWAGVVPLEQRAGTAIPDPAQAPLAALPSALADYRRSAATTGMEKKP
jgi:nitroimidazol reductase NimA-like FMN-containing flavoprotein (pyridoxamine 5'-phosphate oxidase superfamily)